MRISVIRLAAVAMVLIYALGIVILYRDFSVPRYGYMGYRYTPNLGMLVLGAAFSMIGASLLPLSARRPGTVFAWILFVLVMVPIQVVMPVATSLPRENVFLLQLSVLFGFLLLCAANMLPVLSVPVRYRQRRLFWVGFALLALAAYGLLVADLGIPTSLPSFSEAYDARLDLRETMVSSNPLVPYVWVWVGKVINPLIMAFGIKFRRPSLLALGFLGQVYLYAMSGAKSVLLSAALLVALALLLRFGRRRFGLYMITGAVSVLVLAAFLDSALSTGWFTALFVHRLIILPGILSSFYFEFFSWSPKAHLGYSVLSWAFDYPYDRTIPFVIGRYYYGSDATQANANLWADGYANFGYLGIILVSIIAGIIVWAFNCLARNRHLFIPGILAGFSAFSLSNASVFGSILTHGIALSLLIALILPADMATDSEGNH